MDRAPETEGDSSPLLVTTAQRNKYNFTCELAPPSSSMVLLDQPSYQDSGESLFLHPRQPTSSVWEMSKHMLSFADQNPIVGIARNIYIYLRLCWFQIVLVSVIVTLSRGVLNALNAVGAYGTGDVNTATIVNLLESISFSCLSWMTGAVVNVIGCRNGCLVGSTTTVALLTALLLAPMLHLAPNSCVWGVSLLDGLGSGLLWTSVGTMTIKYPHDDRKGFASTVLFAIFSTGAALGGLMAFAFNATDSSKPSLTYSGAIPAVEDNLPIAPISSSGIQPSSYIFMIGLTVTAVLLCFLIIPEMDVRHADGSPVVVESHDCPSEVIRRPSRNSSRACLIGSSFRLFSNMASPVRTQMGRSNIRFYEASGKQPSDCYCPSEFALNSESNHHHSNTPGEIPGGEGWSHELSQLLDTITERPVQFLVLFSFASLFHQTYLFNGVNFATFNNRTRGLNCFMYWLGRIPAGFMLGHVVDDFRFSSRTRALNAFALLIGHMVFAQALTMVFWIAQRQQTLDIAADPALTALAFATFFLYGGLDTTSQSFAMWLFSVLGRDRPARVPHYVAVYRTFQGLGVAFAWAMDLDSFSTYRTQFTMCVLLWIMALPGLLWLTCNLSNNDVRCDLNDFRWTATDWLNDGGDRLLFEMSSM